MCWAGDEHKYVVIPGREHLRASPEIHNHRRGYQWIRGLRQEAHPGMTNLRMRMPKRQLKLGAFMRPVSIHTGAWRYPGAWPDANFNFAHIKR